MVEVRDFIDKYKLFVQMCQHVEFDFLILSSDCLERSGASWLTALDVMSASNAQINGRNSLLGLRNGQSGHSNQVCDGHFRFWRFA